MQTDQLYYLLNNVIRAMLFPLLPRPVGIPVPDLTFNHSDSVLEGTQLFLFTALICFSFPIILLDVSLLSGHTVSLGITKPGA